MPDVSNNVYFAVAIAAVVLLFLSTMASTVSAVLMMGFNSWLKVSINEVRRLADRQDRMEHRLENEMHNNELTERRIVQLYHMMADASDMGLTPEDISRKIRARIKHAGVIRLKEEEL